MMNARAELMPSVVDRIKATLVGLRMPRALEIVDVIVRQLERGEVSALDFPIPTWRTRVPFGSVISIRLSSTDSDTEIRPGGSTGMNPPDRA